jgi:hypothetical protein
MQEQETTADPPFDFAQGGDESKKGDFGGGGELGALFCGVNRGAMHGKWEQMVVI